MIRIYKNIPLVEFDSKDTGLPNRIIPDGSVTLRQIIQKATTGQMVDGRELAYSGRVVLRRDDYDITDKARMIAEFDSYLKDIQTKRDELNKSYADMVAKREQRIKDMEEKLSKRFDV